MVVIDTPRALERVRAANESSKNATLYTSTPGKYETLFANVIGAKDIIRQNQERYIGSFACSEIDTCEKVLRDTRRFVVYQQEVA